MSHYRSLQSPIYDPDDADDYTDLKVLQSPAGWYVGTMYVDPITGYTEPGSRESVYFGTPEEAAEFLRAIESGERHDEIRRHP